MNEEQIKELEAEVLKKQMQDKEMQLAQQNYQNVFNVSKENQQQDKNGELVKDMFSQAICHQIANDKGLNETMLSTAKTYVNTEMQTISTDVDTKHKEAVFNNNKDACESYGFNEKTTPTWAVKVMKFGYSIMLALWLFIGSFTFMPVIFVAKKIQVAVKRTWIAIVLAVLIYAGITFIPIISAFIHR